MQSSDRGCGLLQVENFRERVAGHAIAAADDGRIFACGQMHHDD